LTVFIGLGNPGTEYTETRHNAGFWAAEKLAHKTGASFKKAFLSPYLIAKTVFKGTEVLIIKPLTYMNKSGIVHKAVAGKYGLEPSDIYTACDNLDLKPGSAKLKLKGSAGGHNGLKSIIDELGTELFPRFFIGIGHPGNKEDVIDFVLSEPPDDEKKAVMEAAEKTAEAFLGILEDGPEKVMNMFNRKS
jgi:PTH1 family peptidyl-tRNA hydrolase